MIEEHDIWAILLAVNEEMRKNLELHGGKTLTEQVKEANSRSSRIRSVA